MLKIAVIKLQMDLNK